MSLKSVAHSGRADSLNYGSATTPPIALAAAVAADVLASPFTTVRQSSSALVQELPTARSIAERADWLYRIALAREGMGRREDAVATYREALEGCDTQHLDTNQRALRCDRGNAGRPTTSKIDRRIGAAGCSDSRVD
jgi:hypothetical protein